MKISHFLISGIVAVLLVTSIGWLTPWSGGPTVLSQEELLGSPGHRRFEAPYHHADSWIKDTFLADDAYSNANRDTGGFVCSATAVVGAAKAAVFQTVDLHLDRSAEVHVKAEIEYHGGSKIVGIGAFAGLETIWGYGQQLNKANLEGGFTFDALKDRLDKIADLKNLDVKSYMKSLISDITGVYELSKALEEVGDPKTAHVNFSFQGSTGYNPIHVGLRTLATGAASGTGVSLVVGRVKYIEITFEHKQLAISSDFETGTSEGWIAKETTKEIKHRKAMAGRRSWEVLQNKKLGGAYLLKVYTVGDPPANLALNKEFKVDMRGDFTLTFDYYLPEANNRGPFIIACKEEAYKDKPISLSDLRIIFGIRHDPVDGPPQIYQIDQNDELPWFEIKSPPFYQKHQVKISKKGERLTSYIDGEQIATTTVPLLGKWFLGLAGSGGWGSPSTIYFDNVQLVVK